MIPIDPEAGSDAGVVGVGDHEIYWQAHGPPGRPTVMLLHSGLGSIDDWRGQTEPLTEAGFRVVAFDRWGYGRSSARPGFRPPDFAADIVDTWALADALGVVRAILVGHSDGGTISLGAALRAPGRVSGLVVVAAHVYVEFMMQPGIAAIVRRYEEDSAFRDALERRHGAKAHALLRDWCGGWFRREAWAWDMRDEIVEIACPTLVVQGTEDEHASRLHAEDIAAAIPEAELWLVPGVGHMVPQTAREAFNARLLDFLARLTGRAAANEAPPV